VDLYLAVARVSRYSTLIASGLLCWGKVDLLLERKRRSTNQATSWPDYQSRYSEGDGVVGSSDERGNDCDGEAAGAAVGVNGQESRTYTLGCTPNRSALTVEVI
jgi:hypothetical protein